MRKRTQLVWSIAAIGWMAVIFGLSSMRGSSLPPGHYAVPGHFLLYAVLGVVYLLALPADAGWRGVVVAAMLAAAYGATDELHQSFVPGRTPDVLDWLVDVAGALSATALLNVWQMSKSRGHRAA